MNDIFCKTLSQKFEQIIKSKKILSKKPTKKSLTGSSEVLVDSPVHKIVHSPLLIQLNKSS
jgi:hypothetical protein